MHFYFENDKKRRLKAAFWVDKNHHQIYLQSFRLSPNNRIEICWDVVITE